MTESSYTDILVNTNSSNLVGYLDRQNDYFRVTNKNFSSWSFDGYISSFANNIVIWDKANRAFNFGAGDYVSLLGENNAVSNYQITSVTTDPDSSFFDDSLFPQGRGRASVTAVSGNGTQIVYTAANTFVANQRVRISGISPDGYNSESALIISANSTTFTVAGTQTGTATLTGASVELVTSFLSDIYVSYLDENLVEQVLTIVPLLEDGYPVNRLNVIQEDWKNKGLGSNGWLLSSSGNAIFNNIAVRGEIEATSGNFLGNLTVNNGTMKIGAAVSRTTEHSISEVEISNKKVLLKTDDENESLSFAIGDTIIVSDLDFIETGFMDLNGIFTVSYVSSTQVGYDIQMSNAGPFTTSVGYVALESASDGIFINTNNYWYSDGTFKVGGETNSVSWNNTTLNVKGTVTATSGEIGGWTLNSEELFSDISAAGNTYRTGIKAGTGIGGGTYTPSILYMVHDHDVEDREPAWSEPWTPFYADSNGKFSLAAKLFFDQDIHNPASGSKLTAYFDSGRFGGTSAVDPKGWQIGKGTLSSGSGTGYVALASQGSVPDAPATEFQVKKITVDAEGDGYSSIFLELYSPTMLTFLANNNTLGYDETALQEQGPYVEAIYDVFYTATLRFVNNPAGTNNIEDTTRNPQLSIIANRYLTIQDVITFPHTLDYDDLASSVYIDGVFEFSPASGKVVLVIYGEDYAFSTVKDEQIVFQFDSTISIANPGIITKEMHGLMNGDRVKFSTTGSLPTGITAGTAYYVVGRTLSTFSISSSLGGSAIQTSGSQSGTHTVSQVKYDQTSTTDTHLSSLIEVYPVQETYAESVPVFYAGNADPNAASLVITNTGDVTARDLTVNSVETSTFVLQHPDQLGSSSVTISDTEPENASAGDIWIDIS